MKPELDPVHYDIRALSREILLRHDASQAQWQDSTGATIILEKSGHTQYASYELSLREQDEVDFHYYVYSGFTKSIRYDFPYGTHHKDMKLEDLNGHIEQILLTGAVFDMVPDTSTENYIQKALGTISNRLAMEDLAEVMTEDDRSQKYIEYLGTSDPEAKTKIVRQMYDISCETGRFTLNFDQFENAFRIDVRLYSTKQKQLEYKSQSEEITE